MKKYHLALILLTGLLCAPAEANTLLSIVLDSPTLTGSPGDFLQFFGTVTNTTGADVYLNADNFSLTGFDLSAIDDSPFFANTPPFLSSSGTTGDIELFDVTIPNPFTDSCVAASNCGGTFQVLGGADGTAQDVVGTAYFTVNVQEPSGVPEPSTAVLMSGAVLLLLVAGKIVAHPNRVLPY
jgi:hypothetical protein